MTQVTFLQVGNIFPKKRKRLSSVKVLTGSGMCWCLLFVWDYNRTPGGGGIWFRRGGDDSLSSHKYARSSKTPITQRQEKEVKQKSSFVHYMGDGISISIFYWTKVSWFSIELSHCSSIDVSNITYVISFLPAQITWQPNTRELFIDSLSGTWKSFTYKFWLQV